MRSLGMCGCNMGYQPQSQESLRLISITVGGKLFRLGDHGVMHSAGTVVELLGEVNHHARMKYGVRDSLKGLRARVEWANVVLRPMSRHRKLMTIMIMMRQMNEKPLLDQRYDLAQ